MLKFLNVYVTQIWIFRMLNIVRRTWIILKMLDKSVFYIGLLPSPIAHERKLYTVMYTEQKKKDKEDDKADD